MNKEVIIDGVNVAGCEFHSSTPSSELCYMKGNKCNDNSNCPYKQLQRKEQECEELKCYIKEVLAPHAQMLQKQNERFKQVLEKIEEIIHNKSIITYEIRDIKTILNEVSNNDK